jgi:hypothetical protein
LTQNYKRKYARRAGNKFLKNACETRNDEDGVEGNDDDEEEDENDFEEEDKMRFI